MSRPQVVIDTNVLIAALRSRHGASALLLSMLGDGSFEAHLSIPLALEYEEVLLRQRVELDLTTDEVDELVNSLCAVSVRHETIYFSWRPSLADRRDEHILDLAVKARCDAIVTFNVRNFAGAGQFGIRVIPPQTFLREIGAIR